MAALLAGDKTRFKDWETETPYFEGCLPIQVMAARGPETLRFGPMKPVGLTDPRTGGRPHAVVQLRQDNALGTLYNMVGFQTKLTYGEQVRIFRTIPGLERAECREGGIEAWIATGHPVRRGERAAMSLERQVRIAAGTLVALGSTAAWLLDPAWIALPAFVGSGLVFAGITDTCGMGLLLARMPWNRRSSSGSSYALAT